MWKARLPFGVSGLSVGYMTSGTSYPVQFDGGVPWIELAWAPACWSLSGDMEEGPSP
jgi:hypothetical protein